METPDKYLDMMNDTVGDWDNDMMNGTNGTNDTMMGDWDYCDDDCKAMDAYYAELDK